MTNRSKMRYLFTGCVLLLFQSMTLLAQDTPSSDYVVLYSGDTLYGTVNYIDEESVPRAFYKKIRLTTPDGRRKKFRRTEVAAFNIDNVQYQSFWLHQSAQKFTLVNPKYHIDRSHGQQHFLRIVRKGALSHYELEWFEQGNATLWSMALLKKQDASFLIRADQGLLGLRRKVLFDYFIDCPPLKEAIKSKQLNDVREVVAYYNHQCM